MAGEGRLDIIESSRQHTADDVWGHRLLAGAVGGFQRERQLLFHLQRSGQRVGQDIQRCWRDNGVMVSPRALVQ